MRNADIFEIDHRPLQFEYREKQLRELASALKPGLDGYRPFNVILRGLPGTGKTTSVKTLFDEIESSGGRLIPVYVNCQNDRTKYAIFSAICGKLHGHRPPPSGLPFHSLVENVGKTVISRNIVLVVCLDDANYLLRNRVLNNSLYCLLRLYEEFPGAKAGVILAVSSMDVEVTRKVDQAVNSVLQASEIYFPPYNRGEVRRILEGRVQEGLVQGVMPDGVLDLITDRTMETSDLRVGLDLIRRSVRNAEENERDEVKAEDVEYAFEESRYCHLDAVIEILSPEERRLLYYLADLSQENGNCMTSGGVYAAFHGEMDICYTTYYERLKKMDHLRLIDLTYRTMDNTSEIAMRYDGRKVKEKCYCPD